MLILLQDLGPAGAASARKRVGPPACCPHGARPVGGRSRRGPSPAPPRPLAAARQRSDELSPPDGLPVPASRAGLSPVQASERPRTPVKTRAAGPTRAPCLLACNAAELGPRPGKGSARPSCPSPNSPWGLNTDCRRLHPGPAQNRLAGMLPDTGRGGRRSVQMPGGRCGFLGNVGPCVGKARARGPTSSGSNVTPHGSPIAAWPSQGGTGAALSQSEAAPALPLP